MSVGMKWWNKSPKKLTVLVVAAVIQVVPFLDEDTKRELTKLAAGYIVGQGIADWGKERAKIEQQPAVAP